MYSNILSDIICQQYEESIEKNRQGLNNKALLISFSINVFKNPPTVLKNIKDERYPSYDLLIFGESNYIGVYLKDSMLHPEEKSQWYCLAYHDSCWRSDGVNNFLWRAEKYINIIRNYDHWFKVIKFTASEKQILREVKNNYILHPLFENQ